jgi:hypothetical protein
MVNEYNDHGFELEVEASFDGTIMLGSMSLYTVSEQTTETVKIDGKTGPQDLCKCPGSWHF